jgi:protease-4
MESTFQQVGMEKTILPLLTTPHIWRPPRQFPKSQKVVAYSQHFDNLTYYVATAADSIIAPPPAMWHVPGLRADITFLKEALARIGVQAEIVNVSPYKTVGDVYARSDMSPEHRAMVSWLMDGRYETLVNAIAGSRHLEPDQVEALIDRAPLTAREAQACGLFDAVLYEDELAEHLAPPKKETGEPRQWWPPFRKKDEARNGPPKKPTAHLKRWSAARSILQRPLRWRSGKYIGVIMLEGLIMPGRSHQFPAPLPLPFVQEQVAGAETVAQHFRDAEKDDKIAAVVLYINSGGGSSLASDLIWREAARVRRKKPVVVCMGDLAASGGYYAAMGGGWVIAQPMTTTGSIGVIMLKLVTAGLYDLFKARRVLIDRGANAGLYDDDAPFTPEKRAMVQSQIDTFYSDFKRVVMDARQIDEPALEAVAGGRVWLGSQALAHKLIDQLGDMQAALEKAKELAKLPANRWTTPVWYYGSGGNLLAPAFPPSPADQALEFLKALPALAREQVWMLAPFEINIK